MNYFEIRANVFIEKLNDRINNILDIEIQFLAVAFTLNITNALILT